MKRIISSLIISFILTTSIYASVYKVGSTQTYLTPNALYLASQSGSITIADGDTIDIDSGVYVGQEALAVWMADDLLIRGIGNMPHLRAAGQYIWGKGIWVIAGNNCRVENIEFSEAAVPDNNGAGIRLDGNGLTVTNCYFHNNEDGILTNNSGVGDILIEHCDFEANGAGDGFSHNIYVGHVNKFTMKYCYMHHCDVGNQVKSRADTNIVLYNRIMDEATGNSSMLLDLPNGGFSIVTGNIFHQGPNAQNGRSVSFGTEGTNPVMELYMTNNTFVNERFNGRLIDVNAATTVANLTNSILVNYNVLNEGPGLFDTSHVIHVSTLAEAGLDDTGYKFDLLNNSVAIDAGIDPDPAGGMNLTPNKEYAHPHSFVARISDGTLDIGAYEYQLPPTNTYYVSNNGDDSNTGLSLAEAFLTLQHASDVLVAGDLVLVEDGTYVGFDHRNTSGTAAQPIEFIANGSNVLINQSGPIRNDGINIENADYIILDGFIANDMSGNGNGIRVVLSDFSIVRNCSCDNNAERGIFTAFTDDILIEYNLCTNSIDEHGIYVSNSSDRPIIRYNECYGNNGIGIHMNGDLSAGGDGIISDAKIYGNLLHNNNQAAGINMDGLENPIIYNNLIYNNHSAQGIALFQQDGAIMTSGAKIYNNTIIVPDDGRWGILMADGANVGTEIYNNIIINLHAWRGAIAAENLTGLSSDYNILSDKMSATGDGSAIPLADWQALGQDANSFKADLSTDIFVDNDNGDYHLVEDAQPIDIGTSLVSTIVMDDFDGNIRPIGIAYDVGAYEANIILAVDLLDPFTAELKNDIVFFNWVTANEVNSDYFIISRSSDIKDWVQIAKVKSSNSFSAYQAKDRDPISGISYYRLTEVDKDGKRSHLGIISIQYKGAFNLSIYPNPSTDCLSFQLSDGGDNLSSTHYYQILDTNGRAITQGTSSNGTSSNGNIDVSKLLPGSYLLRVNIGYKVINQLFVIK